MPVHVSAAPLPIQFPSYGLGKQRRMAQVLWTLCHVEDLEDSLSSWMQLSLALAIAAVWAVKPQMEDSLPGSL